MNSTSETPNVAERDAAKNTVIWWCFLALFIFLLVFQIYFVYLKFLPVVLPPLSHDPDTLRRVKFIADVLVRESWPWIGATFGMLIGQLVKIYLPKKRPKSTAAELPRL